MGKLSEGKLNPNLHDLGLTRGRVGHSGGDN
jgi:hypothetical protein